MTADRKIFLGLLGMDAASVLVVFNVVSHFRGHGMADHFIVLPLAGPVLAVVLALYLIDGYTMRSDMLSLDYASQHAIALFSAMLFTLLATYAIIPVGYELQSSRIVIALSYLALTPATLGYRRLVYLQALHARGTRSLVFLGDRASADTFREECAATHTVQPVIFVPSENAAEPGANPAADALHPFEEVLENIRTGKVPVEAIILRESSRELPPDISRQLVQLYFSGVPTYTLELFHQVYWRKIPLYRLNQTWLFQEGFQIAREPVFERMKRIADIALALAGLVLAAPLILLGGLAVWIDDRGPVFFAQNRVGKNHTTFRLYKLRSMRHGGGGDLYTQPGDARITRVGRLLRATRIDEFPQLWNVLRGDMSLIGPRAEWDRLVENYEREIPCYHFRHLVKPGITGWAQVNYPYGANLEDTLRKLEFDLYYIRHFSFTLDASIVLKTIHIMLFGKGR
jgi:exopolysaccharide biosynthesis polyprenyl glycosylphosphotransferase